MTLTKWRSFITKEIRMSKNRWAFRPAELTRAVKAVLAAGLSVSRIRINPQGEIDIETGASQAHDSSADLERWLTKRAEGENARSAERHQ
jgi:hypothetical protein